MQAVILLFLVSAAAFVAAQERIVGGTATTIKDYPQTAALLTSYWGIIYGQRCGGTILNTRSVLTTASCGSESNYYWRIRLGSTYANSGGTVYLVATTYIHNKYNSKTYDYDVRILQSRTYFSFGPLARPAALADPSYNLRDNEEVLAVGWGPITEGGKPEETLRRVPLRTVNNADCKQRYEAVNPVTENMLCVGLPGEIRGQCKADSGSPLFHNNVVVGIYSWGRQCGQGHYPSVNTRISRVKDWILEFS